MSIKRWMLGKVNAGAPHAGPREARRASPTLGTASAPPSEPTLGRIGERAGGRADSAHLGPYAPLIGAIREALEHFAATQLRLHLAIAEQDRYVLTSVEVESGGGDDERALLKRFIAEFRPEQIKHYLARDVIAALRNASAIDLSQFAGLNALAEGRVSEDADMDPYEDLLADLRSSAPARQPVYEVTLLGRWSHRDLASAPRTGARDARGREPDLAHTPLAARSVVLDVEDATGARRVELPDVMPGRRYVIGKDAACDIVVDGVYASRRHCELWLEGTTWRVGDAGSTNGIRVETDTGLQRAAGNSAAPLTLRAGASLVLSAHASGTPQHYPRLILREDSQARDAGEPASVATPIAPPLARRAGELTIAARMRSGVSEVTLGERTLPLFIGRSRNQALVIDASHDEVSGRHLEIVGVDDSGASVVVVGDNGVTVDGVEHACGTRFHWRAGETMLLGHQGGAAPGCLLTLARA